MKVRVYKDEEGYLQLVRDILKEGVDTPDRTSVGECRKLFNVNLWFDLRESQPIPTVRNIPVRWAFEEFWFFMSGSTDTKVLESKGITLWKGNTSREFLIHRGLPYLPEGDMGKAYGHQWRSYGDMGAEDAYWIDGIDQLKETINALKNDPYSRRILTTFWNPQQSEEMALLPCFYEHKFNVEKVENGLDVLHMSVGSRSCDIPLGLPFNYTQYGLYLKFMAKLVNMEAGTLCIKIDDAHIYKNQRDWCEELVTRDHGIMLQEEGYKGKVTVEVNKTLNTVNDLVNIKWEDIEVTGLVVNKKPFVTPKPDMAI